MLRHVCVTTPILENEKCWLILNACLWLWITIMQRACAVYYILWAVRFYNFFSHYLINGTIFRWKKRYST